MSFCNSAAGVQPLPCPAGRQHLFKNSRNSRLLVHWRHDDRPQPDHLSPANTPLPTLWQILSSIWRRVVWYRTPDVSERGVSTSAVRRKQRVLLKSRQISTRQHGVKSQNTVSSHQTILVTQIHTTCCKLQYCRVKQTRMARSTVRCFATKLKPLAVIPTALPDIWQNY